MNILVYPSQEYLKYLYVLLISLFETHSGEKINIHIFEMDYSEENKKEAIEFCSKYGCTCSFYHIDPEIYKGFPIYSNKWPIHHLFDILPHYYLPENMERCMCLETDMIVTGRLDELYNMDFQDNYMICAPAKSIVAANEKAPVFNTGTIMFNLKKMREDKIGIEDYYRAADELRASGSIINDLLMFNCLFRQKGALILEELGLKYNFRYSVYEDHIKEYGRDYVIQELQPAIVHYMLREFPYKPWDICFTDEEVEQYKDFENNRYFKINKELNDYWKLWWVYAEKTPYYEMMKEQMLTIKNYVMSMMKGTLLAASNETVKMEAELEKLRAEMKQMQKELSCYKVLTDKAFLSKVLNDTDDEFIGIRNKINHEISDGIPSGLIPKPDKELIETGEFRSLIYEVNDNTWYKFIRIDDTNRLTIFSSVGIPEKGNKVTRIVHTAEGDNAKFYVGKGVTHILIYISANDRKTYPLVKLEKC